MTTRPRFCCIFVAALLCIPVASSFAQSDTSSEAATSSSGSNVVVDSMAATAPMLPPRPIPYPVMYSEAFEAAVQKGTRTKTGEPGPNYWTNTADYTIDATLDPETKRLSGTTAIRYQNNSPDDLTRLIVHLRQNLHAEGAIRNREVQITGGMQVDSVSYGGTALNRIASQEDFQREGGKGYVVDGTRMVLLLPDTLASGASGELSVAYSFEVPEAGAPRMGQDGEVFYLGYWYPQMAVYDDVDGWNAGLYQGNGEFYMGYGTYDVAITVPEGWLVGATGTLQNPDDVLPQYAQDRLDQARSTEDVVAVVSADERGAEATTPSDDGTHTWRFRAEDVRDFAFGTSDKYVWDATHALVGESDQDTVMIHAFYRPDEETWARSAEYGKFSIEHLSDMLVPYPYPHMTTVEGLIGGGMEYPMITLIGGARSDRSLFGVTYHEISHMWFPMIVGQNEKAYTWMDEGTTSFNTTEGEADFYDEDTWQPARQYYYRFAGQDGETPSMRHADEYPADSPARVVASYSKPSVMLHALRGVLGDETFFEAYREYTQRWAYKHPQPYDFFNTFEEVAGRDLDWFWTPTLYETWTMDQAVASVEEGEDATRITIEDQGLMPMPVYLRVEYADGRTVEREIPVDNWLNGNREVTVEVEPGQVQRVVIDPEQYFPDVDRADNTWGSEPLQDSQGN